jgi:hypothetical protein
MLSLSELKVDELEAKQAALLQELETLKSRISQHSSKVILFRMSLFIALGIDV